MLAGASFVYGRSSCSHARRRLLGRVVGVVAVRRRRRGSDALGAARALFPFAPRKSGGAGTRAAQGGRFAGAESRCGASAEGSRVVVGEERTGGSADASTGGAAAAPEQMSSGRAAPVPEHNGAGASASAGASPTSFVDGGRFFKGPGSFLAGARQSSMPQPWMLPQSSDPATWDKNPTPPGGFTNFIQLHLSQNFHFVGGPAQFAPFKPPRTMEDTPTEEELATPHSSTENSNYVSVDSGDELELPRTEKRILWTQEEDVRLMSSWLHNSTDSSIGADRKNEQYWYVVDTYNETTSSQRRRNAKQAKDRWHKVNKWTDLFHSAWLKARRVFTSGYNDQMWIDKAHVFYVEDNKKLKLGHFVLMDVWYTVRNEAKWITYNNGLKQARKRKSSNKDNEGEDMDNADLEDLEEIPRPMRQKKKAEKAALEKKAKNANRKDVDNTDLEEMNTFGKIQDDEHANRLKVLEVQKKLPSEKIEQAKLAHLAAKEQKEAAEVQMEARKYEVEARMFETYNQPPSRYGRSIDVR
ncbi:hypothetical protein SETIT_7G146500v2 [Setaria italica]|uniref:Myb-like domain-containing protein n=2 Tax=Setaria italica TaxID=4555 RepID=A0A368RVY7_SETIT|nr:uncharacterized protein LOC101778723 isoform X1 [Setaria italica]XP_012703375.1 uncharacterized protein LOC101778723 isoform X1 [Setaria italica]RCV34254.1 hypothetical protein SETIT_7G146500v2 [Setaria italica]